MRALVNLSSNLNPQVNLEEALAALSKAAYVVDSSQLRITEDRLGSLNPYFNVVVLLQSSGEEALERLCSDTEDQQGRDREKEKQSLQVPLDIDVLATELDSGEWQFVEKRLPWAEEVAAGVEDLGLGYLLS